MCISDDIHDEKTRKSLEKRNVILAYILAIIATVVLSISHFSSEHNQINVIDANYNTDFNISKNVKI